jgi:ligand-binding SRPBCC domain-containing protein
MKTERRFRTETLLSQPIEVVFPFFADAKNLERITPPFLRFRVLDQSTPEIQEGTVFNYRLRIRGIPIHWRSQIEQWEPGHKFVDRQLKGPYKKWVHLHEFIAEGNSTRMIDTVDYDLPMGTIGRWVAGWYVDRDVKSIFRYRETVIREIFENA